MVVEFTFKRGPRITGLAAATGSQSDTEIKLKGKRVGYLRPPHWSDKGPDYAWKVHFRVKSDRAPGWTYVRLKARLSSEAEAREFVTSRAESICKSLDLQPES